MRVKAQIAARPISPSGPRQGAGERLEAEIRLELLKKKVAQDGAKPPTKEQIEASAQRIKDLQKERIAVLTKLIDHRNTSFLNARVTYDEVLDAQRLQLEAKLDAAETDKEGLTLRDCVSVLKVRESWAKSRLAAARGTLPDLSKATANRLEAETHLELVKMKVAQDGGKPPAKEKIEAMAQGIKDLQKMRDRHAGGGGGRIHQTGQVRA